MAEIINLRKARKKKSLAEKDAKAKENRRRFGASRADREAAEADRRGQDRLLDGSRLNDED